MLNAPSDKVSALADAYFSLLARHLPVCCLSDEFDFMPRAQEAGLHLHRVDNLDREGLEDLCFKVRNMKQELNSLSEEDDPGRLGLLGSSMEAFLLRWDTLRTGQRDPSLYLKVAVLGLEAALEKPGLDEDERNALCMARLKAVPVLLTTAEKQLADVPLPTMEASLEMLETCRDFLHRTLPVMARPGKPLSQGEKGEAERALGALDRYRAFLQGLEPSPFSSTGPELFQETLNRGYGWKGELKETREILEEAAAEAEAGLKALAREIEPGATWQDVYSRLLPDEDAVRDPVSMYQKEAERLEAFFGKLDIFPMPRPGSLKVEPTPDYLGPVRATASYSAPCFPETVEQGGRFFIEGVPEGEHSGVGGRTLQMLHRDYRYLTAHETCPGHHVLDWARLHLKDPVRRQVESALFYEGWACYAEQLVDECGYESGPRNRFIRTRRELWRAVRGKLDVDLQTGRISLDEAAQRLQALGQHPGQARKQARRITLTPAYQLCYTLGKRRLLEIRDRFVPPLPLKTFHAVTLSNGQAPFSHLEHLLATV